jgi:hypothetical protein
MPRRKGKIETITTRGQDGITCNNTVLLGETRTKETKTSKGETIIANHDKGRTISLELTSLALYVESMEIIHTTAPKFPTSNK